MENINKVIVGMVKEIKEELFEKEITLLEMDNTVLNILESYGNEVSRDKNSIFDALLDEYIENGSHAYSIYIASLEDNVSHDIDITFEVVNIKRIENIAKAMVDNNEDLFKIIVKVTQVEEI